MRDTELERGRGVSPAMTVKQEKASCSASQHGGARPVPTETGPPPLPSPGDHLRTEAVRTSMGSVQFHAQSVGLGLASQSGIGDVHGDRTASGQRSSRARCTR